MLFYPIFAKAIWMWYENDLFHEIVEELRVIILLRKNDIHNSILHIYYPPLYQ